MKEHVLETIKQLQREVQRIEDLITALTEFSGVGERQTQRPPAFLRYPMGIEGLQAAGSSLAIDCDLNLDRGDEREGKSKIKIKSMSKSKNGEKKKVQTVGVAAALMSWVQACEEEFTAEIAASWVPGKFSEKQIGDALKYQAKMGRVKIVTPGKPGRPAVYARKGQAKKMAKPGLAVSKADQARNAQAAVAQNRVAIPGLDQPGDDSLASRLDKAKADLKAAEETGRESLARILRDKVAQLERQLANWIRDGAVREDAV